MYECGMRLGMELCTPDGVKQQGRAYLSCLNCLKLVRILFDRQDTERKT